MNKTEFVAEPGKQEISYTRYFDASPQLVFNAYTNPGYIEQWWGPRNLSTAVEISEARPGGTWRYANRDASGREYWFHGVFHSIDVPGRIVRTSEYEGMPGHVSLETLTIEPQGAGTKVSGHVVYQSVADRDGMLRADMEKGMSEGLDRLAELLAKLQPTAAAKP